MNELPSSTFRTAYAKLSEPTVVTVNGHPIGQWIPAPRVETQADVVDASHPSRRPVQARDPLSAQTQRDDLLRKINRSR